MNINVGAIGLLVLALGLHVAYAYFSIDRTKAPTDLPWVPIQVGKTRSFHSQTRDASTYIEAVRRRAIIRNPEGVYSYKGSTNGSLEWNFLTAVCDKCPDRKKCPTTVVWDAGFANTETCDIIDGDGDEVFDFGNADTNVCVL